MLDLKTNPGLKDGNLSDNQDLLRMMLANIPEEARVDFLSEVLAAMSPLAQQQVLARCQANSNLKGGPADVAAGADDLAMGRSTPQIRVDQNGIHLPKTAPHTTRHKPSLSEAEINRHMKAMAVQGKFVSSGNKNQMRKQLLGCFGILLVAIALIVGLGVGGRELFELIKTVFQ